MVTPDVIDIAALIHDQCSEGRSLEEILETLNDICPNGHDGSAWTPVSVIKFACSEGTSDASRIVTDLIRLDWDAHQSSDYVAGIERTRKAATAW